MHDAKNAVAGLGDDPEGTSEPGIARIGLRPVGIEDGLPDPGDGNAPLFQQLLRMG